MAPSQIVMLVEDEPMIALMVADMLEARGFQPVGPFSRNGQALAFLGDHRPDVAIVDFSLGDGGADPLASRLREMGIPFLVISGFNRSVASPLFDGVPWLEKPFSERQLCDAVRACLRKGARHRAYV